MGQTATRLGLVAVLLSLAACVATGVPHRHKGMNRGRACQEMRTIYGDMVQMNCGNGRMKMRHMDDEDQVGFVSPQCGPEWAPGQAKGRGHHRNRCRADD